MDVQALNSTARQLVAAGKGILAADESTGTIKKRFDAIHVESTEDTRRAYRDLLFTTPGVEKFISGVILYEETLRQSSHEGPPFPELLARRSILPGIKVDKGAVDMAGFPGEKITEGLDGLRGRLAEFRQKGARFAKWRAVITIGPHIPTHTCLEANAEALARYAALCQEADLVPIVEPEVLMDGSHDLARCWHVTEATLQVVFARLSDHRVALEGMLLKPNMVLPGKDCPQQASPAEVARATLDTLRRTVPAAVPGIVFLSGGQTPEQAARHLSEMNKLGAQPWQLSFSYGRALQDAALRAWQGQPQNVRAGQDQFYRWAQANGAARTGQYGGAQ